ncbi:21558_t:CDS:2 [Gigaspora margarita]|uniref:21558_t:CDS:1 n=1 Tax=Gigaspora margarita TaxID=4874 RepID=A0ABM8W5M5_GIGMA|nr:21558_t:CDS:2 [Gigaspora margarita]
MSKTLGELVVVAIKARNLVARDVIGKGDPFATFRIGDMAKRTKTDKRGGQHPVWDEELRFQVTDDPRHKVMKVQVYNEDKREHVLVGDEIIKLDEVLKSGEWDAWHEIKFRNKYAGEVFLEMTFYNAGAPPPVEKPPQPTFTTQYTPHPSTAYRPPNSYPNSSTSLSSPIYPPQTSYSQNSSPIPHNSPRPQSNTPYNPVSQSTSPYPPPGTSAPYPPQAPQGTSAPYPPQRPQGASAPYPPQGLQGASAPYPPPGAYQPQGPSAPYPPQAHQNVGYSPQPPRSGSPVSFPVPIPTPNAPGGGPGGYPQYNGFPPQGGYQQPPYPPNHAYPPPNNQVYPPPNFGQGYPPTGGPY